MGLKKFLNGLPMLGLVALLACPGASTAELNPDGTMKDDPNNPLVGKVNELEKKLSKLDMMSKADVLAEIKAGIAGRRKIDLTGVDKHKNAWAKVAQIMAVAHPEGCSFFYPQSLLGGPTATNTDAGDLNMVGSFGGTLKVAARLTAGTALTAAGTHAAGSLVYYTFDKYSVDGIYQLSGELMFTTGATAFGATGVGELFAKGGDYVIVGADKSVLTLKAMDTTDKTSVTFTFGDGVEATGFKVKAGTGKTCPVTTGDITVKIGATDKTGKKFGPTDDYYKALFGGELATTLS